MANPSQVYAAIESAARALRAAEDASRATHVRMSPWTWDELVHEMHSLAGISDALGTPSTPVVMGYKVLLSREVPDGTVQLCALRS